MGIGPGRRSSRPRVSVLMPVRDAADVLEGAVESIRRQTLESWEMVAVDDGSGDRSLEVLRRCAAADGRVRVFDSERRGIVEALERGRALSRAPLIARMDADDLADPQRLEAQVSFLESHPDLGLCGTHVRYFPRRRVRAGAKRYESWLNSLRSPADLLRDLWIECPLAHPSFTVRASALDRVGGYRDRGWPEDYDLVLRLWVEGVGMGVVPRVLHHWRESPDRLSRTDPRYGPDRFRAIKLHFLSRTLLLERNGIVIWGAGRIGKSFARDALERGLRIRAFVDLDPRKVGQEIHGAPVIPPAEAARLRDALSLAAVGQPGARGEIRQALQGFGWQEGLDFVAIA